MPKDNDGNPNTQNVTENVSEYGGVSRKEWWVNKFPKKPVIYKAQYGYKHDVRNFVFPRSYVLDEAIKKFNLRDANDTTTVYRCFLYVFDTLKYVSDTDSKSQNEFWQYPEETFGRRIGDCVAEYEEIYVKDGLKCVKDLSIGDEVLSYDFEKKEFVYKPIIKIWDKGVLPIKRVHLRNGQHIDVTNDHPLWVRKNQSGDSVYEKTYLSDVDLTRWWKRKLPVSIKIPYEKSTPLWDKLIYRVIGHYLAEGWSDKKKHSIYSSGFELDNYVVPILEEYNIPFTYCDYGDVPRLRFLTSDFKDYLKVFKNNSFDITIPEEVLNLPEEYLEELLYGMWLGDGTKNQYPDNRGYSNNKSWTYSTSSEQLAKDIQRIGLHLGRTFHIWKQQNHKGVGKEPIWRINYNTESHFLKNHGYKDISEVSISYVEDLDEYQTYDFEVKDTHTFVFKNGLISHNCEDGAILLKSMTLCAGVPDWKVKIIAGEVKGGGHAYCTYIRDDDTQTILDWCIVDNYKTKVNMTKGKSKRFIDLNVGDEVVGYNELTGALEPTKIVKLGSRVASDIYRIVYDDGSGFKKSLSCTSDHPWMLKGIWVSTKHLSVGDEIYFVNPKSIVLNGVKILEIEKLNKSMEVFNLHCEPHNNYFVNGLLSHNCYWPNKLPIDKRPDLLDEPNYKDIWFSFNNEYSYAECKVTYANGKIKNKGGVVCPQ